MIFIVLDTVDRELSDYAYRSRLYGIDETDILFVCFWQNGVATLLQSTIQASISKNPRLRATPVAGELSHVPSNVAPPPAWV